MEIQASQQTELPALIQEAKDLAKALSAPGNASEAQSIQERLHALQKSGAGWVIADGLLGSDDPSVRFFGALTLTMKIHQDWDRLGEEKAQDLLIRLVDCFILLVDKSETPMVMRKFLTCMTAFFFKSTSRWTLCVRHIAVSMANGKYVSEEQPDTTFEQLALPSLGYERVRAVLSFSTTLAEESLRYSMVGNGPADRLESNVKDALFLINFSFQRAVNAQVTTTPDGLSGQSSQIVVDAIKSLHDWLNAIRAARIKPPGLPAMVTPTMDYIVQFLMDASLAPASMEILTETLTNQPKLLETRHLNGILDFLISPQAEQYAMALLKGDDEFQMLRFLELLTQYASAEQVDILTRQPQEKHQKVLFLLYRLLHGQGFAGVDDRAIIPLVEYWTEAADNVNELIMEGALDDTNEVIKRNFIQVIVECHDKLRYPDSATLKEWDDDDVTYFNAFRRDFTDFLLASYPLLGLEVVSRLQEGAISALNAQNWDSFEVAMFCLVALAESVADNEHADSILQALFHSHMFTEVWLGQREIPMKSRQTLADVIAKYTAYFNRDHSLLPAVLNFLFGSLDSPVNAQTASKAISTLCQTCRKSLLAYVDEFVDKFYQLRSKTSISAHALERVSEGVSAVIQAVPSDEIKASLLVKLLNPLYQQAVIARQEKRSGQYDAGLGTALMVTRCTGSIGKGLRAPDDVVIDLEAESTTPHTKTFWTDQSLGGSAQTFIVGILDIVISEFAADGEIIETACDVLKAGYTEQSPGPYVLPPEVTVRFVKAVSVNSARFPTVMGTASAFLASHAFHPSEVNAEVVELSMHIYQLVCHMERYPEQYDPEVAHSCIDFLKRLLPKYRKAFFSLAEAQSDGPPPMRGILGFTLEALKRPDPLPLRAACSFWSTLLTLPEEKPELTPAAENGIKTEYMNGAPRFIDPYLTYLGDVIIRQVAGRCARSDLDHLCDVIKKFVFKHQGAARMHFGNALQCLNAPTQQGEQQLESLLSGSDRERFLTSILTLRGGVGTNQVVREFWILCRGQGFAYTS